MLECEVASASHLTPNAANFEMFQPEDADNARRGIAFSYSATYPWMPIVGRKVPKEARERVG